LFITIGFFLCKMPHKNKKPILLFMNKKVFTSASALFLVTLVGCSSGEDQSSQSIILDENCTQLVEESRKQYTQENITDPSNTGLRFLDNAIIGCSSMDALVASASTIQDLLPENMNIKLFILGRCTTAEKPEVKQSMVCKESSQNLLNLSQ
jgi:ABC-type phosphate/phosphonate transport system substrate-binding protein